MSWRPLKNFNGYEINEEGKIKTKHGIITSGSERGRGYKCFSHYADGKETKYSIHRLVAETFIPNPENKPMVDHIDGNPSNNHVSNLRWATGSENQSNRKMNSTNTSGFQGVTYDKNNKSQKKWRASFIRNKKLVYLGHYLTAEEANQAILSYKNKDATGTRAEEHSGSSEGDVIPDQEKPKAGGEGKD